MPITYKYDKEKNLIFEKWTGCISIQYLKKYWLSYLEDPEVMSCRRTLVDLREATIEFYGYDLHLLIDGIVIPKLNGRDWKTAIVVSTPTQYGVSRQYGAFADLYSSDQIFYDYDQALMWIGQQEAKN